MMTFPSSGKQGIHNQIVYKITGEIRTEATLGLNASSTVHCMSHLDQLANSFELLSLLSCGDYYLSSVLM